MKSCALSLLIAISILKCCSADWKLDLQTQYIKQISSIVNSQYYDLKEMLEISPAREDNDCQEVVRLVLKGILQSAYYRITQCTNMTTKNEDAARVCAEQLLSDVSNKTKYASNTAGECLANSALDHLRDSMSSTESYTQDDTSHDDDVYR